MKICSLFLFIFSAFTVLEQNSYYSINSKLTDEELAILAKVQEFNSDLHFSQNITRHYIYNDGKKELIKTVFNFNPNLEGFYFDYYIY